jgi:hypothetical protein
VLNATLNNISAITWLSLLLVEETGIIYIYLKTKIVVIAEFILTWKPMGKCKKCLLRNCCTDEKT